MGQEQPPLGKQYGYRLADGGRLNYDAVYRRHSLREQIDCIATTGNLNSKLTPPFAIDSNTLDRYLTLLQSASNPSLHHRKPLLLDAGAGLGEVGWWLSSHSPFEVIAVDYAFLACKLGFKRFGRTVESPRYITADLHNLPFRHSSFSAVISIDSLYFLPHPLPALSELARVMLPGAPLIFTILSSDQSYGCALTEWTKLLKANDFTAIGSADVSACWQAQMHEKHAARWAKRKQIMAALGVPAAQELAVSRTLLGLGGAGPTISTTRRAEIYAQRAD